MDLLLIKVLLYVKIYNMASIKHSVQKIKAFLVTEAGKDCIIIAIIFLASFTSFGLGRMSAFGDKKTDLGVNISCGIDNVQYSTNKPLGTTNIGQKASNSTQSRELGFSSTIGPITASRNGSKYYTAGCSTARIKEDNKIFFNSEEEARQAGYEKSLTCK